MICIIIRIRKIISIKLLPIINNNNNSNNNNNNNNNTGNPFQKNAVLLTVLKIGLGWYVCDPLYSCMHIHS